VIHHHEWSLILGADGRGMIYGDYEGYVRSCRSCGDFAPDYAAFMERRKAERLAEARRLVAEADR
jgi:hypothetical protein